MGDEQDHKVEVEAEPEAKVPKSAEVTSEAETRKNREARLLVTPLRILIKLAVAIAPEKYKARIRAGGKKMTARGFSDAAVVLTLLYSIGTTLVMLVALVGLALVFSMMED